MNEPHSAGDDAVQARQTPRLDCSCRQDRVGCSQRLGLGLPGPCHLHLHARSLRPEESIQTWARYLHDKVG